MITAIWLDQPVNGGNGDNIYTEEEIKAICEEAHKHDLVVGMDIERLANYLARNPEKTYADYTWKAGVDICTLGIQKNGGPTSSAVIAFPSKYVLKGRDNTQDLKAELSKVIKANGGRQSRGRINTAGWQAMISSKLWRRNAGEANRKADRIVSDLSNYELKGQKIEFMNKPLTTNMIFVKLPPEFVTKLNEKGYNFSTASNGYVRMVASYDVREGLVDKLIKDLAEAYEEVKAQEREELRKKEEEKRRKPKDEQTWVDWLAGDIDQKDIGLYLQ